MTELNHIIRRYMDDLNVNTTQLSKSTGIGRVNLGYKLNGKRSMTVEELKAIVRALEITEKDLMKGFR